MYPNLYYVFKDWFGVNWPGLRFLNTFGLMVALSFILAAWLLAKELKRKEQAGLLLPMEEEIYVGKPAAFLELIISFVIGFIIGFKLIGLFLVKKADMTAADFIFSFEGSFFGGLIFGGVMSFLKWQEKNKKKLKAPEKRSIRIWPHDRVGDIVILGLVFGILGAKLFDNFEHWNDFIQDPLGRLFSQSGLTFYGGLILAAITISVYAIKKNIQLKHLVDAAAPALMIAYAVGRIGCQVAGDGDWGVYNTAYAGDYNGGVHIAKNSNEFKNAIQKDSIYFINNYHSSNPSEIPHQSIKGLSFLPVWLFAYTYPQNVNNEGVEMKKITEEHRYVLPVPVFPTPLYETIICMFLFFVLWKLRKKIKTPLILFGIYLILNGGERFIVEMLRINQTYNFIGLSMTQAQIIAIFLVFFGILLIAFVTFKNRSIKN